MGTVIANVFAEQWMYMLLAAVAVAATFLIKKFLPDFYRSFLKGGLVVLVLLLIVLALLVHAPDLFLLIPIIIICCELFGYGVTGKVVAVLFVDFLLIQVYYNFIPNKTAMTVIFYVLQILAAICIGIIMDKYVRAVQEEKREGKELTDDELAKLQEMTKDDTSSDSEETAEKSDDDFYDLTDISDTSKSVDDITDEDLENHIDEIMRRIDSED